MADFSISGRLTVAGLKRQFEQEFGLELRVYAGPAVKPITYWL